jgi:hypothetical protein
MALPLDGAGSTAGLFESCASEMGPVKSNAIALNKSRRLASDLQALLGQNAATLLKTGLLIFIMIMASLLVWMCWLGRLKVKRNSHFSRQVNDSPSIHFVSAQSHVSR